ncbi:TNT domain-containing protein, partial [Clostridium sp.]|uniref:TNT domain-containing protein n=1 Tax=Clostridium sp. TaxID=1506 RepID=UPI00321726FA
SVFTHYNKVSPIKDLDVTSPKIKSNNIDSRYDAVSGKTNPVLGDKYDVEPIEKVGTTEIDIKPKDEKLNVKIKDGFQTNKRFSRVKVISNLDRAKIEKWKFTPDDKLYLKYKDVYDNPKFFNESTGDVIYPGMNGDVNIDGFINGKYDIETLQPGKIIERYGNNGNGKFFSPSGTSYDERALPPFTQGQDCIKYEVLRPIDVKSGTIAPWFNKPGKGRQYFTDFTILDLNGNLSPGTLENLLMNNYIRILKD